MFSHALILQSKYVSREAFYPARACAARGKVISRGWSGADPEKKEGGG